ncbi:MULTISPECIES: NlpC/P60 family protein [Desulfitobacterium]|uniref:Cell wall-associated hydrolase, invasion-associated protein n=1 Tax=Desulfitobacterium dehalogenans (strain ATCC 51507 / DSM 9161 / JW/IU-DC1) TaxID=756499 RepID=I4A982_DESDJ|nr:MULTISPECIES: NlpC/P60 family protein [Desulfitobacterium]AFM00517.1 cell wall-associated hydrolase, invasion-associated protein [Desulfitobacterium dehalogenans ATCC 51507]
MKNRIVFLLSVTLVMVLVSAQITQAATPLLKVGSRGSAVVTLQSNLKTLGYEVGAVDGIFGAKTKTAVQAFQKNSRIQVDGIVGPKTQQALTKALSSKSTTNRSLKTQKILSTAKGYTGVPYLWGGTTPSGFDCSGFTQYVFKKNGITLPRTSSQQYQTGTAVSFNSLIPGDLVFFNFNSGSVVSHVGIYLGDGQFISATSGKGVITYSFTPYWKNAYVGAKRVY